MSVNTKNIQLVQTKLAQMMQMVRAHEDGVTVAGEKVDLGAPTKAKFKQQVNELRVACVTTLNKVKIQ